MRRPGGIGGSYGWYAGATHAMVVAGPHSISASPFGWVAEPWGTTVAMGALTPSGPTGVLQCR